MGSNGPLRPRWLILTFVLAAFFLLPAHVGWTLGNRPREDFWDHVDRVRPTIRAIADEHLRKNGYDPTTLYGEVFIWGRGQEEFWKVDYWWVEPTDPDEKQGDGDLIVYVSERGTPRLVVHLPKSRVRAITDAHLRANGYDPEALYAKIWRGGREEEYWRVDYWYVEPNDLLADGDLVVHVSERGVPRLVVNRPPLPRSNKPSGGR